MITKLLRDILGQPDALLGALAYHRDNHFAEFRAPAGTIRAHRDILIVAIGASFNAGLSVAHALRAFGRSPQVVDASEFGTIPTLPADACIVLLSRSGKSVELVGAAARCQRERLPTIAFTNDASSPLARKATHHVLLQVPFDHAVSIATYTSIILVAVLAAQFALQPESVPTAVTRLEAALLETKRRMAVWQAMLGAIGADFAARPTYFLGRGESLASAHAAMLLWQEVIKIPAVAMTTGSFRHGPQEVLRLPTNAVLWLSPESHLGHDRQLAGDLQKVGARVLTISTGENDLAAPDQLAIPTCPAEYRAMIDVMPLQLCAERLAGLIGVNPDQFLYCNYIVEKEGGL